MSERGWSARVLLRYTLFQLPAVAGLILILMLVRRWVDMPAWFVWGLIGIWVAKDVIMFPFVWRGYDRDRTRDANSMIGVRGIAKDRLAPSGYIRVHGELWQAEVVEGGSPIDRGQGVRVGGLRGLTLLVQPDNGEKTE